MSGELKGAADCAGSRTIIVQRLPESLPQQQRNDPMTKWDLLVIGSW